LAESPFDPRFSPFNPCFSPFNATCWRLEGYRLNYTSPKTYWAFLPGVVRYFGSSGAIAATFAAFWAGF
jgi:hypothetical protein